MIMKKRNIYRSKILKVLTLLFAFTVFSCSDLLDAENPNSLVEGDLTDPRSARPMVNGAQATVTRAIANILTPYSISSDEMVWSGSRDAWQQLNLGQLADFENEFTDAAFAYVGEARWWADEVIKRMEGFQSDGTLIAGDELALARSYLYGATIYITIGDMYTDFVFSSKLESGPAIGPANMNGLYDTAIGYLNKAIALNQSSLTGKLQAMLARAQWSKVAWTKARERTPATALINNAAANTAATAALAAETATPGSASFVLDVDSSTPDVIGGLPIGSEVNDRKEQRLSDLYIIVDPATGNSVKDISSGDPSKSISLMDPIDNIPDPVLYKTVVDFVTAQLYPDFTQTSDREMYLILAEAALAASNMTDFATNINALRAKDGLTAWNMTTPQLPALDLLKHERRVNLYLQGRRLTDHYRFNSPSPYWLPSSDAISAVTFFPIGISETRANTLIN
ncbi:MAG TPA: hypothetical protein DIS90_09135 [Cytophagales bacterium]|mgnify:CR=1 FL=1|nr:hypothetical protein [Cytophagales bacterium]HCR55182.1 hypothetical protein [Cytophagales bacterium]